MLTITIKGKIEEDLNPDEAERLMEALAEIGVNEVQVEVK